MKKVSTAGEAKLRDWAERYVKSKYQSGAKWMIPHMEEAGRELVRQCAEIARTKEIGITFVPAIREGLSDAILREFGMDER